MIQPGALGDSLLSLAVAEQYPGLTIEMLGHLEYISVFPGRSAVATVADIDTAPLHSLFADPPDDLPPAFANYLSRFDAILTWLGSTDTSFCRHLSTAVSGSVIFIDRGPPPDYPHHVVHYWFSQMFSEPPTSETWTCRLTVSAHDLHAVVPRLSERLGFSPERTAYLVFHPGAGSPKKCWPVECFAELASLASKGIGCRIVYLLGPAEQERFAPADLQLLASTGQVLSGLDITSAAILIRLARAFVGHDSGPTHLAAAFGTPTLAIFGPTNPTHWRPLGCSVRLICSHNQALLSTSSISFDATYRALRDLL